jgi:hypothetical protein
MTDKWEVDSGTYCRVHIRCYATTMKWEDIPEPFLGNGSVNTFPLLCNRFLIVQQVDYNNGKDYVFYVVRHEMLQARESVDSYIWESVKRELEPRGKRITTVGAVTRKRLVTD